MLTKKINSEKGLELILTCDIIIFIMEVVTFIYKTQYSHYEELKLGYHQRSLLSTPSLLKEILRKIKY